jgi:hypothetical protein
MDGWNTFYNSVANTVDVDRILIYSQKLMHDVRA